MDPFTSFGAAFPILHLKRTGTGSNNVATMEAFTSPVFPVEVLVTIAEFLAGDGCLGTIASLNACSTLIHQETLSVLYETVDWTGDRRWWVLDGARVCDGWRHVRFLKIEAREYGSIAAYQAYLCSERQYWSHVQCQSFSHEARLPPSKDPANDLSSLFPRLAFLIMADAVVVDRSGLKVLRCCGHLFKPVSLTALLDSLGTCFNRAVCTPSSASSVVDDISSKTPRIVLKELKLLGDGGVHGAKETLDRAGTLCKANLPYEYHQIFDSTFGLILATTAEGQREKGTETSLAIFGALSLRCTLVGGVETVDLSVSCPSALFESVVQAVVAAELLPCVQVTIQPSEPVDESALTKAILRLGEAYASRWKRISQKAKAYDIFLRIYGRFCDSNSSRERPSSFVGYLRLLHRGPEGCVLAVDVRDYINAADGHLQQRNVLQHDYPETRGPLLSELPAVPFCPGSEPPLRLVPSPAPIAKGFTVPEVTRSRTGTADPSLSRDDSVASHRGSRLNSGEVTFGSSVTSGSAITARLPRLATSYGTAPTRRPRYI